MILIGIDPGTKTGLAVYNPKTREFYDILTLKHYQAFDKVRFFNANADITVFIEDARQRKWYGPNADKKKQGAGAIKKVCALWEEFLKGNDIPFQMVPPVKGGTKLSADVFRRLTGWEGRTSEHARDAAMLVFNRYE